MILLGRESRNSRSGKPRHGATLFRVNNRDIFGIPRSEYFERINGEKKRVGENGNRITAGSFIHDENDFYQTRDSGGATVSTFISCATIRGRARPEKKPRLIRCKK